MLRSLVTVIKFYYNECRIVITTIVFTKGLRGVKRELLQSLTKCGQTHPPCRDVLDQQQIGKLDINGIDYNQVIITHDTLQSKFCFKIDKFPFMLKMLDRYFPRVCVLTNQWKSRMRYTELSIVWFCRWATMHDPWFMFLFPLLAVHLLLWRASINPFFCTVLIFDTKQFKF